MSEETKSYHPWFTIFAAIIIVAAATAAYVYFARIPTPYAGQILSVNIYPIHQNLDQPTSVQGIGGEGDVFNEVLVLANVRVNNVAKIPLYLQDMSLVTSFPGETDTSSAASASDFDKLFIAYPDLAKYKKPPMLRNITIQPGQKIEGMMVFNYQMDKAKWDTNTGMDIHLSFIHQNPLVLHVSAANSQIVSAR
ncbi:MAG TPA: hypothetical protein VME86_05305 [Acidobacteriaceae bacterium]|nr:hypothetical protein [Acidobacteriaceae bacterium]